MCIRDRGGRAGVARAGQLGMSPALRTPAGARHMCALPPRPRCARGAALMAADADEQSRGARRGEGEGGGKKGGGRSLLLRLLIFAASSSAAVLARALRPFARALGPVARLLRSSSPRGELSRRALRVALALTIVLLVGSAVGSSLGSPAARTGSAPVEVAYSAFLKMIGSGAPGLSDLTVSLKRIDFSYAGRAHFSRPVYATPQLLDALVKSAVDFSAPAPRRVDGLAAFALPLLWLGGVGIFLSRQARQMTANVGTRASARNLGDKLSFDDVQGIARAKVEVAEVVAMLRDPRRYASAGVRLPSGLLLAGPPGTGKTLLARVLAAEAGVPFFFCSGSDFVEIFVGRGASRLRALFLKAAKAAPCVVFVDELDALGKRRSLRLTGSNDEAEQTLNQLLACMDGLESSNNGVVVVGATNRPSLLDPALIRPGRFDRIVQLELPDAQGRADILAVHSRPLQLAPDVDLRKVAELGPGMAGAELAAICNEAGIRMVRRGGSSICQADFESAVRDYIKSRQLAPTSLIDKLLLGQP